MSTAEIVRAAATQVPVSDLMSTDVVCVQEDLAVDTLVSMLIDKEISGVPVLDGEGCLVGVVSKTDLIREQQIRGETREEVRRVERTDSRLDDDLGPGFHVERIARTTVGEIMMPVSLTIPETDSLARAAALMVAEKVHRLVVVSQDGHLCGVITPWDITRWLVEGVLDDRD